MSIEQRRWQQTEGRKDGPPAGSFPLRVEMQPGRKERMFDDRPAVPPPTLFARAALLNPSSLRNCNCHVLIFS